MVEPVIRRGGQRLQFLLQRWSATLEVSMVAFYWSLVMVDQSIDLKLTLWRSTLLLFGVFLTRILYFISLFRRKMQ